ncbi:DUF2344 domain-containing protein [bacterium]|nr:DUF2344 domain-containing protein [bacterium]
MNEVYRLRIFYKKEGIARFISHKDFCKIIERTLRRLDTPFKFTEGFHPHPKISFGPSLPVNFSGENEALDIFLTEKVDVEDFIKSANLILPEGIEFLKGIWVEKKSPSLNSLDLKAVYKIEKGERFNREEIEKIGKIINETPEFIEILVKIKNFSHKKLIEACGKKEVRRRIIWNEREI